jgi:hypothetical protein
MKAICDLKNKTWTVDTEVPGIIFIGFVDGNETVVFDNLSFGVIVKDEEENVFEDSFPKNDVVYISTDQEDVEFVNIFNLELGKEYSYTLWAKNAGKEITHTFTFTEPIVNEE